MLSEEKLNLSLNGEAFLTGIEGKRILKVEKSTAIMGQPKE
ncbi:hypothetical protein [Enterococcus sp.]